MTVDFYSPRIVSFGVFQVDLQAGELRKAGMKQKLTGQPFQVLAILLEHAGDVVTREELQQRLWPETFVDIDRSLNTAINKIREALGDSAENPCFVETLPRRGYRFIAQVASNQQVGTHGASDAQSDTEGDRQFKRFLALAIISGIFVLLCAAAWFAYHKISAPYHAPGGSLTRITFDGGLQIGASWSPDGRSIAYSSDRDGKFDIWVMQLSGGEATKITSQPGQNWQPDWSPDGMLIAYRSEQGDGGLYIVPAPGSAGSERRVSSFGFYPRWSPDGSRILFRTSAFLGLNRFYVVGLDGDEPKEVLKEFLSGNGYNTLSVAWFPDGKRLSAWIGDWSNPSFWTVSISEGTAVKSDVSDDVLKQLQHYSSNGPVPQTSDSTFAWSPNGAAIYCQLEVRGVLNIWKISMDPVSLRMTSAERLTAGPGPDGELALSRDGRKLAFTAESQEIRVWVFPFDAVRGKLTGSAMAVSPAGMTAWRPALSRDGTELAFAVNHSGKTEFWKKSLASGRTDTLFADGYVRDSPVWSPNSKMVAYERTNPLTGDHGFAMWLVREHHESVIADAPTGQIHDWTADNAALLASSTDQKTNRAEILQFPLSAAPHAERATREILARSDADIYQTQISPDGRDLVFMTVKNLPNGLQSKIYTTPADGGPWIPITDGKYWEDKPRWSPNGQMIYYVSGHEDFSTSGEDVSILLLERQSVNHLL